MPAQKRMQAAKKQLANSQRYMEVRGVEPLSKILSAFAHTCVSFAFKVSLLKTPIKVGAFQELALEVRVLR